MATFDHVLPTDEELTVPEVNLSSASLRAGAFHMGKHCENQNNVSKFRTISLVVYCYAILYDFLRNLCCVVRNLMIQESVWQKDVL